MLAIDRFIFFEVDGKDVETRGNFATGKLAQVMASQAAQNPALVLIHGKMGGSNGTGGAGFDFDKAEGVAAPVRF